MATMHWWEILKKKSETKPEQPSYGFDSLNYFVVKLLDRSISSNDMFNVGEELINDQ